MSEEERINQPLDKKIENVLPIIYANCMNNAFKEKWKWPAREPETGLFKDKYCKSDFFLSVTVKKKKKETSKVDIGDGEDGSPEKEVIKGIFEM
jgi:hypothetical protein